MIFTSLCGWKFEWLVNFEVFRDSINSFPVVCQFAVWLSCDIHMGFFPNTKFPVKFWTELVFFFVTFTMLNFISFSFFLLYLLLVLIPFCSDGCYFSCLYLFAFVDYFLRTCCHDRAFFFFPPISSKTFFHNYIELSVNFLRVNTWSVIKGCVVSFECWERSRVSSLGVFLVL